MTPYNSVFRGVYLLGQQIGNVTDRVDGRLERLNKDPLIYIGESNVDEQGKNDLAGRVNITIHIYGLMEKRTQVDEVYARLRNGLITGIEEFNYNLSRPTVNLRVLQDVSTEKRIQHYVVEYGVTYSKK